MLAPGFHPVGRDGPDLGQHIDLAPAGAQASPDRAAVRIANSRARAATPACFRRAMQEVANLRPGQCRVVFDRRDLASGWQQVRQVAAPPRRVFAAAASPALCVVQDALDPAAHPRRCLGLVARSAPARPGHAQSPRRPPARSPHWDGHRYRACCATAPGAWDCAMPRHGRSDNARPRSGT